MLKNDTHNKMLLSLYGILITFNSFSKSIECVKLTRQYRAYLGSKNEHAAQMKGDYLTTKHRHDRPL